MTTIAANRESIACDRQFTYNGYTKMLGKTKVIRIPEKFSIDLFDDKLVYVGFCGDAAAWGRAVSWFHDPTSKPPKISGLEMLMLTGTGKLYTTSNDLINWMPVEDKHWAIGTGMQFAIGAMTTGKTPLEAVKVASKHDTMTGMGFKEYKIS